MKTASDDYFFTISPGQNQKLIKRSVITIVQFRNERHIDRKNISLY